MGDTFRKVRTGDKLRIPAAAYNAMLEVVRPAHTSLTVPKKTTQSSGGGGSSVVWAKIIEMPSHQDPNADPDTVEYAGRTYYTCRLLSSQYALWVNTTAYTTGTKATYNDILYTAKRNNTNCQPDISPDDWEAAEEIKVEYAIGIETVPTVSTPASLRDCVPWIEEGEAVPLITRTIDGATRYYLWRTLIYAGGPGQATIVYNPDDKITQAVFR